MTVREVRTKGVFDRHQVGRHKTVPYGNSSTSRGGMRELMGVTDRIKEFYLSVQYSFNFKYTVIWSTCLSRPPLLPL